MTRNLLRFASQNGQRASSSWKLIMKHLAVITLVITLAACSTPIGTTIRTKAPPPMVSDYFVVTTGSAHVDVSYPAGSVHYAPNLKDRTSD
jgi:hypothetical protein